MTQPKPSPATIGHPFVRARDSEVFIPAGTPADTLGKFFVRPVGKIVTVASGQPDPAAYVSTLLNRKPA